MQNMESLEERGNILEEERTKALDREMEALKKLGELKGIGEEGRERECNRVKEEIDVMSRTLDRENRIKDKEIDELKCKVNRLTQTIKGLTDHNDNLNYKLNEIKDKNNKDKLKDNCII